MREPVVPPRNNNDGYAGTTLSAIPYAAPYSIAYAIAYAAPAATVCAIAYAACL